MTAIADNIQTCDSENLSRIFKPLYAFIREVTQNDDNPKRATQLKYCAQLAYERDFDPTDFIRAHWNDGRAIAGLISEYRALEPSTILPEGMVRNYLRLAKLCGSSQPVPGNRYLLKKAVNALNRYARDNGLLVDRAEAHEFVATSARISSPVAATETASADDPLLGF